MNKHSFGEPVPCLNCGKRVASVWAVSQEFADMGMGTCDDCMNKVNSITSEPEQPGVSDGTVVNRRMGRANKADTGPSREDSGSVPAGITGDDQ